MNLIGDLQQWAANTGTALQNTISQAKNFLTGNLNNLNNDFQTHITQAQPVVQQVQRIAQQAPSQLDNAFQNWQRQTQTDASQRVQAFQASAPKIDFGQLGNDFRSFVDKQAATTLPKIQNSLKDYQNAFAQQNINSAMPWGVGSLLPRATMQQVGDFLGSRGQLYEANQKKFNDLIMKDYNKYTPEEKDWMGNYASNFMLPGIGSVENVGLKATKAVATEAEQKAMAELEHLLTYDDALAKRGISAAQRAKMSVNDARELLGWDKATTDAAIGKAKYKMMEESTKFKELLAKWLGAREAAKTVGTQEALKFKAVPANLGEQLIQAIEHPNIKVAPEIEGFVKQFRAEFDALHEAANKAGMSTNYLQDYLTHVWKQTPQEVQTIMQSAGQKFRFAGRRVIPTYEEGKALGLEPAYKTPQQLIGFYVQKMEQTKANMNFFEALKKEGLVLDAAAVGGRSGFAPIIAEGFPTSVAKDASGTIVKGNFFAPTEIAQTINKLLSPEAEQTGLAKILHGLGNVSSRLQDIALAGGIPKTPANFFSLTAGLMKEGLAGRVIHPAQDFLRSFSGGATNEFFSQNADTIIKMQKRGIPLHSSFNLNEVVDKGILKNLLGEGSGVEKIAHVWDSLFNGPTFNRFWPSLEISFFKDVEQAALKGNAPEVAADIAAAATKKFYGIISTDTAALRGKTGQDILKTFAFAPHYRESLINFWTESLKAASPIRLANGKLAFNNPLALENINNTKFLIGSVMAYFSYDKINRALNGHGLVDNPPGSQDYLLIPLAKITGNTEDKTVLKIPFLPSIAYIPRTALKATKDAIDLNGPQVMKDLSGLTSTLVQPIAATVNNEDYWGNQVYDPNAPVGDKLAAIGKTFYNSYSHPYMKAAQEQGIGPFPTDPNKRPPLYQSLTTAAEVPVKWTTTDKLNSAWYYANQDAAKKSLGTNQQGTFDALQGKATKGQPYNPQQIMTEASIRLANPAILKAETDAARKTSQQTGQPLSPFSALPEPYQNVVLRYSSLPPGSTDRKELLKVNPWLTTYWSNNSKFYESLPKTISTTNTTTLTTNKPQASDYVQAQMNAKNWSDPQVQAYLNANTQYTNDQRAQLGLPPLAGYTPYVKKPKKISLAMPKPKKLKTTSFKTKKLKAVKVPKLKLAMKPPKLNIKLNKNV